MNVSILIYGLFGYAYLTVSELLSHDVTVKSYCAGLSVLELCQQTFW